MPLAEGQKDVAWPCSPDPKDKYIVHFPEERMIWSYGSGYGGNALLGKKCLALRIASTLGREQGWLAEHMLIVGVKSPDGRKDYVCAAFPSACGKTNFAMLIPPKPFQEEGWEVTTVGDDIAWIKPDENGTASRDQSRSRIFRRRARNELLDESERDGDDQGKHDFHERRVDRRRRRLVGRNGRRRRLRTRSIGRATTGRRTATKQPRTRTPASRAPITQCPVSGSTSTIPKAFPFRRSSSAAHAIRSCRCIQQSFNWALRRLHGRHDGLGNDRRRVRQHRRSPPRSRSRCCPSAVITWAIISRTGSISVARSRTAAHLPVNWFRKDENGKFLWPGFGENMRVLKWIVRTLARETAGVETPLGWMPRYSNRLASPAIQFKLAVPAQSRFSLCDAKRRASGAK